MESRKTNITTNTTHNHKETDETTNSQLVDLQSSLEESERICKKWKENSIQLQSEINKKQKNIDTLTTNDFKLKSDITQLKKSLESKNHEIKSVKDGSDELKKKLKAASSTADVLSKKCTKQEKNITTKNLEAKKMNGKITELEKAAQQQDITIKNLQKEKARLEKEKETQKRLLDAATRGQNNETLDTAVETTNDSNKDVAVKLRKATQEINSLKDLTRNLEMITRDLQTDKQTLREELDAQKNNLLREKHINNILMNFNPIGSAPSSMQSKPDVRSRNTHAAHAQPPPPPPIQPRSLQHSTPRPEQHTSSFSEVPAPLNHPQPLSSNIPTRNDQQQRIPSYSEVTAPLNHPQPLSLTPNFPTRNDRSRNASHQVNNTSTSHDNRTGTGNIIGDFCRAEFREQGSCANGHNCTESHEINFNKLKRGICFSEFFKKNSCRNGINCQYCHEIPESVRTDSGMMQIVDDKIKNAQEKRKNRDQKARQPAMHTSPSEEHPGHHGSRTINQSHTRNMSHHTDPPQQQSFPPQTVRPTPPHHQPSNHNLQPQSARSPEIAQRQDGPDLATNSPQPVAVTTQHSLQHGDQNAPWQYYENNYPSVNANHMSSVFQTSQPKPDFLGHVNQPYYIPWATQMQQYLPQRNL